MAYKSNVPSNIGATYQKINSNEYRLTGTYDLMNYPTYNVSFNNFHNYESIFIICELETDRINADSAVNGGYVTFGHSPYFDGKIYVPWNAHIAQRLYYPLCGISYSYDTSGHYTSYIFDAATQNAGYREFQVEFRNNALLRTNLFRIVPQGDIAPFSFTNGIFRINAYGIPIDDLY